MEGIATLILFYAIVNNPLKLWRGQALDCQMWLWQINLDIKRFIEDNEKR